MTYTAGPIEIEATQLVIPLNLNGAGNPTDIHLGTTPGATGVAWVVNTDYTIADNTITLTAGRQTTLNNIASGQTRYLHITVAGKTYIFQLSQS